MDNICIFSDGNAEIPFSCAGFHLKLITLKTSHFSLFYFFYYLTIVNQEQFHCLPKEHIAEKTMAFIWRAITVVN